MEEELLIPGAVAVDLGEFRLVPGPKGDTGERGPRGYGLESAVLNPDYTLTLNFEDGSSCTTPSIRGEDGVGVTDMKIIPGEDYGVSPCDTLKITLTDGKIKEFKLYNGAAASAAAAREAQRGAELAGKGVREAWDETLKLADRAADSEALSRSWAVGGTGAREGENTDNSRYWAGRAQADAERVTVPAAEGVYNVILTDRATGERYALLMENGHLTLLGVAEDLDASDMTLIDRTDGKAYAVYVEGGRLGIEEVS